MGQPSFGPEQEKHALLLDLDGTLVTSTFRASSAKNEVLQLISTFAPTNGLTLTNHIRDYFLFADQLPPATRESLKARISEIIEKYELESVATSTLKQGAVELVKWFRPKMPVCIVSNSGRTAVNTTLSRFGLRDYFDFVLSRDETPDLKPAPDGISLILQKYSVKPSDAVMVGDTPMDVIAAKKAGVESVAVADGVASLEDLAAQWPDYLMPDLVETKELLARIWSLA